MNVPEVSFHFKYKENLAALGLPSHCVIYIYCYWQELLLEEMNRGIKTCTLRSRTSAWEW